MRQVVVHAWLGDEIDDHLDEDQDEGATAEYALANAGHASADGVDVVQGLEVVDRSMHVRPAVAPAHEDTEIDENVY